MTFPALRLRRLRSSPAMRDLVQEVRLHPSDLIQPYFVHDYDDDAPIASLPGQWRLSLTSVCERSRTFYDHGGRAVLLFPVVGASLKDDVGSESLNPNTLHARAVAAVKAAVPELLVMADVALDPYTRHGHDGLLDDAGDVDNDATIEALIGQALVLARAGVDVIAPSDMMDGRIGALRAALDDAGFSGVSLLSYTAKFASHLYGPFRDAVGSGGALKGDKKTYQMNPANAGEALREAAEDIAEGADMLMVKPATWYLDVLYRIRQSTDVPVLAYHVSGEYAMLHALAQQTGTPFQALYHEALLSIKRAGARGIVTYGAEDVVGEVKSALCPISRR
jgi:porphobilinogen synthase